MLPLSFILVGWAPAHGQQSRNLLRHALEAMGGSRLERLTAIRVSGIGFTNALEQSERPEGPWIKAFEQFSVLRDLERPRQRVVLRMRSGPWSPEWSPELTIVADTGAAIYVRGDRKVPARTSDRDAAMTDAALAPERLLLTALAAPDLAALPDTTVAGVRNHRVTFAMDALRVEVLIDANTRLPSGYLLRGPSNEGFDWVWGDVTRAVWFSLWSLDPPGIRYPRMVVEEFNGQPARERSYTTVEFDPPAPADSFVISEQLRTDFVEAARSSSNPRAIPLGRSFGGESLAPIIPAPGVVVLPGPWYATIVRQHDGIVILEAPISSEYSAQVLAEAERRFPGMPVTGVVTTSDAWPHLAGVREYVARGIPVFHLDLNRPILARLVAASYATEPDALERSPREPEWRTVTDPVTLGTGENRIRLMPLRGEGAERMVMAYFPAHRLLYASDLIQRAPDGSFWWPQYLTEVVEAVARHGLAVDTVFAMHSDPLPWREVTEAVAAVWGHASP